MRWCVGMVILLLPLYKQGAAAVLLERAATVVEMRMLVQYMKCILYNMYLLC